MQELIDVFRGQWRTILPGYDSGGDLDLYHDERMAWFLNQVTVAGLRVCEVGAFEGAHTCLLSEAGAIITAIENNVATFVRALVAQHIYSINAHFIYGNAEEHLSSTTPYDVVFAVGVLYHQPNPVSFISQLAKASVCCLWTHYWPGESNCVVGLNHLLLPAYEHNHGNANVLGNIRSPITRWLSWENIIKVFEHYGMTLKARAHEESTHRNISFYGPSIAAIFARD